MADIAPKQLLIHPEFSQILTQYCQNDSVCEDSAATLAVRRLCPSQTDDWLVHPSAAFPTTHYHLIIHDIATYTS